jgi:RNA polymerase sigma factor (sigma-70 family)
MASSDLILAARHGDQQALAKLLSECQPDIRRYAQQSCANSIDAEDAVQETMIIVYQKVGMLKVITAFGGWLKTIVKRECLRLARKFIFRHNSIEEYLDDERLAVMPVNELKSDVTNAIRSLPPNYRDVIILRDFEDLTMKEISLQLNITVQNAKVRLHRARFLVREYLLS